MRYMLDQHDDLCIKEQAKYYFTKKFTDCESYYNLLEKLCYSFVWNVRQL